MWEDINKKKGENAKSLERFMADSNVAAAPLARRGPDDQNGLIPVLYLALVGI